MKNVIVKFLLLILVSLLTHSYANDNQRVNEHQDDHPLTGYPRSAVEAGKMKILFYKPLAPNPKTTTNSINTNITYIPEHSSIAGKLSSKNPTAEELLIRNNLKKPNLKQTLLIIIHFIIKTSERPIIEVIKLLRPKNKKLKKSSFSVVPARTPTKPPNPTTILHNQRPHTLPRLLPHTYNQLPLQNQSSLKFTTHLKKIKASHHKNLTYSGIPFGATTTTRKFLDTYGCGEPLSVETTIVLATIKTPNSNNSKIIPFTNFNNLKKKNLLLVHLSLVTTLCNNTIQRKSPQQKLRFYGMPFSLHNMTTQNFFNNHKNFFRYLLNSSCRTNHPFQRRRNGDLVALEELPLDNNKQNWLLFSYQQYFPFQNILETHHQQDNTEFQDPLPSKPISHPPNSDKPHKASNHFRHMLNMLIDARLGYELE